MLIELWDQLENRRKFFENYAEDNHFDPLIAENWYSQPIYQIMAVRVRLSLFINYLCLLIN